MATVKNKKKKKIIIAIIMVAIIAVASAGIAYAAIRNSIPEVSLYSVGTSDIYETVSATGKVSSGAVKEYKVGAVATVKEVNVKVGDEVKKANCLQLLIHPALMPRLLSFRIPIIRQKQAIMIRLQPRRKQRKTLLMFRKRLLSLKRKMKSLRKVQVQQKLQNLLQQQLLVLQPRVRQ